MISGTVICWFCRSGHPYSESYAQTLCRPLKPSRVAVDETAVQIGTEWYWLYAAVDLDSLYLLAIAVISRHGTDPAAAFLHGLTEKYDVSETEFLVDAYGYRTVISRLGLSGRVEYSDRNHIEKWFHTLKQRTDRFQTCWMGSRPAVTEWCQQFNAITISSDRTKRSTAKRRQRC
ncbi:DDE-type integrase/transposase/recombinase [Haloarcula sp. JP-L23]|nr:DDE-type integrase/transposase/recombinase [Haloarcula sp. JP-L23]